MNFFGYVISSSWERCVCVCVGHCYLTSINQDYLAAIKYVVIPRRTFYSHLESPG